MLKTHFVGVEEAEGRLMELIDGLIPGETLHITKDGHTIAKLTKEALPSQQPRQSGSAKDQVHFMADDFNAPMELKDFEP